MLASTTNVSLISNFIPLFQVHRHLTILDMKVLMKKDRNQTPLLTIKNLSNIAPKKQDKNFNVDKGFVNLGYNFTVKTGQKSSHLVW